MYEPCAVSALGTRQDNAWPKKTMFVISSPWNSQYQKNLAATSPLSKPISQKYGITKTMDDRMRYGTCEIKIRLNRFNN